ncbi:hypothetical protein ACFV0T_06130 [Streptomyces sp. NPDC059582]|uniref:hypothetical protein n=1 Tax=Streptomyces sp. NPDC059582 TaxID=3346875 RepID=UPI00368235EC
MGSWKVTLCAGFAVAVTALTSAAYAADGGSVSVTPSSAAPGADVALRVSGCEGTTATAVSRAFVADARLAGADGAMAGEARIRTSAGPGSYDVRITCADFQVQGTVTVSGDGATVPSGAASPIAPVAAGGGGTAHFASVDTYTYADGPGTADTVTGLVLAGVAATAVTLRSARRSRRTG